MTRPMPSTNLAEGLAVYWRAPTNLGGYMHFDYEPKHLPEYEGLVLASDYAALVAERDALREDAERLDWLADPSNSLGCVQLPRQCVEDNLHDMRAAIDDAMAQDAAIRASGGRV